MRKPQTFSPVGVLLQDFGRHTYLAVLCFGLLGLMASSPWHRQVLTLSWHGHTQAPSCGRRPLGPEKLPQMPNDKLAAGLTHSRIMTLSSNLNLDNFGFALLLRAQQAGTGNLLGARPSVLNQAQDAAVCRSSSVYVVVKILIS